jgi:YVTN family beta-propeller protein
MKLGIRVISVVAVAVVVACSIVAATAVRHGRARRPAVVPNSVDADGRVTLPNGWRITPAGATIPLPGDMPLRMLVSADGRYLLVNTGGYHDHSVNVVDLQSRRLVQSVNVLTDWAGMCMDAEGDDVYVAGGGPPDADLKKEGSKGGLSPAAIETLSAPIFRLSFRSGALAIGRGIAIPGLDEKARFVAGLVSGPDESIYAVNVNSDTVYRLGGHPRSVLAQAKVGYRPYGAALSPDGKTLAVSNWGDCSVSLLDAFTLREAARVRTGSHPNDLAFASDGRLFVACSGSNSVSVLRGAEVIETIVTSLRPDAPVGSTPDALAIQPDARRLYVANADNNDVAVVDISRPGRSRVNGFIPTGWYPSALALSPDGKRLFVGVGKGLRFGGNFPSRIKEPAEDYNAGKTKYDYIGDMLSGAVSIVDAPDAKQLAAYTKQVRANLPLPVTASVSRSRISEVTRGAFAKIKHVVFIIRENRTYDQILGDVSAGNGDPNITIFGEQITPNAHALVRAYALFDNLYCSGEVSEDGHEWCNSAYATDDREKGWILSYNGRREPQADRRLTSSPAGYLWDDCARHGLTYRSYGEFASFQASKASKPVYSGDPSLEGHACFEWSLLDRHEDSRDMEYADVFIRELHAAEISGEWPRFMVMSLGEDHTSGLRAGRFTPFACVAANDLGVGRIVEAVSHSKFWKETAIFVIEDDAQDGPDHVDAHRTVGLAISPYVRRGVVDSTFYTTVSMVRTMELILGLPPMTQFDGTATPMYNAFTSKPDLTPYTAIPARIDLAARNPKTGPGAQQSAMLDFSARDRADPAVLNRLLWSYARPGSPMPAPVHGAALTGQGD